MDSNLKIILEEFEEMKGQFVITDFGWHVERLIAISMDDFDYYYVTYDGRKITFNTCVGKVIQLKGKIDDSAYNGFIRIAQLNHFDQSECWMYEWERRKEDIENHKHEIADLKLPNEFLTEVCWDLN